jgi:hypothetical protein
MVRPASDRLAWCWPSAVCSLIAEALRVREIFDRHALAVVGIDEAVLSSRGPRHPAATTRLLATVSLLSETRRVLMARWTETLRATELIPVCPEASSEDNSRIFSNSIAERWRREDD